MSVCACALMCCLVVSHVYVLCLYRMTVYIHGTLQSNPVTQLTIPKIMTGFQLKRQLLGHNYTNHILLYNNRRIDKNLPISRQVPNFASIILCALGKGGGHEDKDNVTGKYSILVFCHFNK